MSNTDVIVKVDVTNRYQNYVWVLPIETNSAMLIEITRLQQIKLRLDTKGTLETREKAV